MCGLALTINGTKSETIAMGQAIKHRGIKHEIAEIDNIKVWFSWLPIVNKNAPMQPFVSGKWMVWLNGYISNYLELAEKYRINLYTDCDTLLLAELFNLFDLTKTNELNGFFSIVAYNKHEKKIHAFTDRYGIKQLYRYEQGDTVYICSEVKGLLQIGNHELDEVAVEDWHYSLGVMTFDTVYRNITRVPYLQFVMPETISISYPDAKKELKRLFDQSIRRNKAKIADGVFLSGGVDSGIIAKHIFPDYSFSMDYTDSAYSEIEDIKLNTTGIHYTMICNRQLFDTYKYRVMKALDDLKAGSCYTNFALTELASKYCTVIYSGAGGDEVFDGYTHRYNREINDVIRRADMDGGKSNIAHKEYDWLFLKGVLVVEDRMAGFHTMETRYPLLDNDFVDFALSLPAIYRVNKRILKDISGLPDKIKDGKKRGFSNPYMSNFEWSQFAMNETRNLLYRIRN